MYLLPRIIKKMNIPSIKKSRLGKRVKINAGSQIVCSSIGDYSYVGYNSKCLHTSIGKYCSISDFCSIGLAEHPLHFLSTSPFLLPTKMNDSKSEFASFKKTIIGNDVWIGSNVLIKTGVTISDGAIIGMGSVVTHNVGPYEIWAGNPAKLLKKRFDEETIDKLLSIKWWDLEMSELKRFKETFNDPSVFIKSFLGEE